MLPFLCFLFWLPILTTQSTLESTLATSAYDVLRSLGLPMGLLPKGVTAFEIDDHGNFRAHLDQACNAKFESELHYDRNVSGTIKYGSIGALSGVSAQELFLWFPVKGIRVDVPSSGIIYFDVGVVYKQFSLSLFETPPDCTAVAAADVSSHDRLGGVDLVAKRELRNMRYDQHFGRGFV